MPLVPPQDCSLPLHHQVWGGKHQWTPYLPFQAKHRSSQPWKGQEAQDKNGPHRP
ncbi:hypothetical protein Thermus77412_07140 [Thermus antranikianii]